jgi:hypothetical protein
MSKTLARTLLLMLLLLLCPAGAEEKSCHASANALEGRIQAAGPSIYMEGSHELVDGTGELVARLSGLEHKVDLASYDGRQVKLFGSWRPTVEAGGKIFEVSRVEALATADGQK